MQLFQSLFTKLKSWCSLRKALIEIGSIKFQYKAVGTIRDISGGIMSCSEAFALAGPVNVSVLLFSSNAFVNPLFSWPCFYLLVTHPNGTR